MVIKQPQSPIAKISFKYVVLDKISSEFCNILHVFVNFAAPREISETLNRWSFFRTLLLNSYWA